MDLPKEEWAEHIDLTFFQTTFETGNHFEIYFENNMPTIARVEEIKEFPAYHAVNKTPFSVIFQVHQTDIFPQEIYKVKNHRFQVAEVFLVPIAREEGVTKYQAVFS